jgi:hypothetical protein
VVVVVGGQFLDEHGERHLHQVVGVRVGQLETAFGPVLHEGTIKIDKSLPGLAVQRLA